jgi:RNA polymerase sigma factor (sigma-70 family)
MSAGGESERFVTTRWTRVLQSRGKTAAADAALSELCEAYYKPVSAFIRWQARDEEKARDLTQEFFARLLKRGTIGEVDPRRGRFRSYLLTCVKNFLRDQHGHHAAAKRNPGMPLQSISGETTAFDPADPAAERPDVEFDRQWALAVIDRALTQLAREHEESGKKEYFETLKPWLTGDIENLPQAIAAEKLQLSESGVKTAIHRLRRRFRDLVKAEIAATLPEPDQALVADELSYLVSILR